HRVRPTFLYKLGVDSCALYLLFLHRNGDHHVRSVEETHKGVFREHVHVKLRSARRVGQIDRIGHHRGDARHAAARPNDSHFRRVHVELRDGIAVMPFAEEADMNRHRVIPPRLEMKAHYGGDGAHQAHTAHDLDVTIANAEGALPAGRARQIDYYGGMIRLSDAAQSAGRAAQFEFDGTRRRFGADLHSLREILILQADVGQGGNFGLGGDQRPDHHGDHQGKQLPAEILKQQIADPLQRADHGCALTGGGDWQAKACPTSDWQAKACPTKLSGRITDAPAPPAVYGWLRWSAGYRRRNPRTAARRAAARRNAG